MTLNETQSAAICQAFCGMYKIADTARARDLTPNIYINETGTLEVHIGSWNRYFYHVKDRTPKEIDDFICNAINTINDADIR